MTGTTSTTPADTPIADAPPAGFDLGRLASKLALCLLYVVFAYSHLRSLGTEGFRLSVALLVAFETVMVGLVFFRRDSTTVDLTPPAIVAGLIGSFAALGFRPSGDGQELLIGQTVQVAGVVLLLGASVSLGRSFGLLPANRGIRTGGLYRFVRHPFYSSYLVIQAGYIASHPTGRNVAVLLVGLAFQVLRIRYEERLLLGDRQYQRYAATVRWHLIPGLW